MRPRCAVDAILTFNVKDEHGAWIPMRINIGSWITLHPGTRGAHVDDAAQHGGVATFEGAYKAKVLKFRLQKGSLTVPEVLVQHAYMLRQLDVDIQPVHAKCNYLYPSTWQDWVDVHCITGVVWVLHSEIGEAQRGHHTHEELLQNGIFFYNALYKPRTASSPCSWLEPIPLPPFNDPEWPLPDMTTSEYFRFCLRRNFLLSMRPTIGSRCTRLQWSMPIHVMVDLFSTIAFHRTSAFFVFRNISNVCFTSLMDDGWDVKHTVGADIIKCVVSKSSVIFKFHVGRSVLYVTFQYTRLRFQHGRDWEEIDQAQTFSTTHVHCEVPNAEKTLVLEVGCTWSLLNIRHELSMHLASDLLHDFTFHIVEDGKNIEQVTHDNEVHKVATDLQPPKLLCIVPTNHRLQSPSVAL